MIIIKTIRWIIAFVVAIALFPVIYALLTLSLLASLFLCIIEKGGIDLDNAIDIVWLPLEKAGGLYATIICKIIPSKDDY